MRGEQTWGVEYNKGIATGGEWVWKVSKWVDVEGVQEVRGVEGEWV